MNKEKEIERLQNENKNLRERNLFWNRLILSTNIFRLDTGDFFEHGYFGDEHCKMRIRLNGEGEWFDTWHDAWKALGALNHSEMFSEHAKEQNKKMFEIIKRHS